MEGSGRRKKSVVNLLGKEVDAHTKEMIEATVAMSMGGVKSGTVNVEPTAAPGPNDEELRNIAALDVVLREPIMCGGFRTFLERNYCAENLLCWKEVEEFKSLTDQSSLRLRAKEIYKDFIADMAPLEVNVDHHVRLAVEATLADPAKEIEPSFFNLIQRELFDLMRKDSFLKFLTDPTYHSSKAVMEQVRCLRSGRSPESDVGIVTERDWNVLLATAVEVELPPGTRLVEQGLENGILYRLVEGRLLVEKASPSGPPMVVAEITRPGTVFGEMSLLGSFGIASASIVVGGLEGAKVAQIEVPFLNAVFLTEPLLAQKFFSNMGARLSNLLRDISSLQTPEEARANKRRSTHMVHREEAIKRAREEEEAALRTDQAFNALFRLKGEILIKVFRASLDRVVQRKGLLYITKRLVCFHAKVFGQSTKEVFRIVEITGVSQSDTAKASILKLQVGRRALKFTMSRVDAPQALNIIQELIGAKKQRYATPNCLRRSSIIDDDTSMTGPDWDLLLSGSMSFTSLDQASLVFHPGDVIVQEGKRYSAIFQIASGSCKIEKAVPGSESHSVVLGILKAGEIFGEMSFFTDNSASATVVAEEEVEMYMIDGEFVKTSLSKTHPDVMIKFYRYLCSVISRRIEQREEEGWGR